MLLAGAPQQLLRSSHAAWSHLGSTPDLFVFFLLGLHSSCCLKTKMTLQFVSFQELFFQKDAFLQFQSGLRIKKPILKNDLFFTYHDFFSSGEH
jgi:hypothetical protein